MALGFLLDEHLRGPLWKAIQNHNARGDYPLDAARVGDPFDLPLGLSDPLILQWAERECRILLTFDEDTVPIHLGEHLRAGSHSPGIFIVRDRVHVSDVLEFLILAAYASEPDEWRDRIQYLP